MQAAVCAKDGTKPRLAHFFVIRHADRLSPLRKYL